MIMGRRYFYRAPRFNRSYSEPYPSAAIQQRDLPLSVNTAPSEQHVNSFISIMWGWGCVGCIIILLVFVSFTIASGFLYSGLNANLELNGTLAVVIAMMSLSHIFQLCCIGTVPPQFLNCYNTICLLLLCICANCYFHGIGIEVCNSNSSSSNDSDIRLKNFSSVGHVDIGQLTESPSVGNNTILQV